MNTFTILRDHCVWRTTVFLIILSAALVACNDQESAKLQDPTEGRVFPRKLVLVYYHADWTSQTDTLWYDYVYDDGRIASITRHAKMWNIGLSCNPCPEFRDSSRQVLDFNYLDRQIRINVTENESHVGAYTFDFIDDAFQYPSTFKAYDANGLITADTPLTYEGDFLNEYFIYPGYDQGLSVESENILMPYVYNSRNDTSHYISYEQKPSPINQFSGFSYFTYRPFGPFAGIDPIGMAFHWFRPSRDLIQTFRGATYSYSYTNEQLTSIYCVCNCEDYVTWEATIEY